MDYLRATIELKVEVLTDGRVEEGETLAGFLADYRAQWDISREVLAGLGLDAEVPFRGDRTISARWVLAHLVDETARHAGHLDVVRDLLDGTVGDRPRVAPRSARPGQPASVTDRNRR